ALESARHTFADPVELNVVLTSVSLDPSTIDGASNQCGCLNETERWNLHSGKIIKIFPEATHFFALIGAPHNPHRDLLDQVGDEPSASRRCLGQLIERDRLMPLFNVIEQ